MGDIAADDDRAAGGSIWKEVEERRCVIDQREDAALEDAFT